MAARSSRRPPVRTGTVRLNFVVWLVCVLITRVFIAAPLVRIASRTRLSLARRGPTGKPGDWPVRGAVFWCPGPRPCARSAGTAAPRAPGATRCRWRGCRACRRCCRDVLLDRAQVMTSASAIPWFDVPVAISSSTSRSRGVSSAAGRRCAARPSRVETMVGSRAEPPAATRRTASRNSVTSLIRSLSRYRRPRPIGEQLLREADLDVLREDEDADRGCSARIWSAARRPSSV